MSKFRQLIIEYMGGTTSLVDQMQWEPHPAALEAASVGSSLYANSKIGRIFFDNGYGVQASTGLFDKPKEFECILLKGTPNNYKSSVEDIIIAGNTLDDLESVLSFVKNGTDEDINGLWNGSVRLPGNCYEQ